jgi:hypothetical protein
MSLDRRKLAMQAAVEADRITGAGLEWGLRAKSTTFPGQPHLHFHCARRSVAFPKQGLFAAD